MIFFRRAGWADWDVEARPAIPEGMPVLVDDLLFEDDGGKRPVVAMNRRLRELPTVGGRAPSTWVKYARTGRDWAVFLTR